MNNIIKYVSVGILVVLLLKLCSGGYTLDEQFLGEYKHDRLNHRIILKKDGSFKTEDGREGTWEYKGSTTMGIENGDYPLYEGNELQQVFLSFNDYRVTDSYRWIYLIYGEKIKRNILIHKWDKYNKIDTYYEVKP